MYDSLLHIDKECVPYRSSSLSSSLSRLMRAQSILAIRVPAFLLLRSKFSVFEGLRLGHSQGLRQCGHPWLNRTCRVIEPLLTQVKSVGLASGWKESL